MEGQKHTGTLNKWILEGAESHLCGCGVAHVDDRVNSSERSEITKLKKLVCLF